VRADVTNGDFIADVRDRPVETERSELAVVSDHGLGPEKEEARAIEEIASSA
jgi:hypothetical protein